MRCTSFARRLSAVSKNQISKHQISKNQISKSQISKNQARTQGTVGACIPGPQKICDMPHAEGRGIHTPTAWVNGCFPGKAIDFLISAFTDAP